jgi:predicted HTH transcriptional regulator
LEDVHIVENRGSGIASMIEAMRKANLEPPRFDDKRTSFLLTFRSHTLMGPQAIEWLNQFAAMPLSDDQRVALVYLKHNRQMTNSDYQRLNHVDSVTANRQLRNMAQLGLIEQHSTRRWAHYTLSVMPEAQAPVVLPSMTEEEKVLEYICKHGSITNTECRQALGFDDLQKASRVLKKMQKLGKLKRQGQRRWAKYTLP